LFPDIPEENKNEMLLQGQEEFSFGGNSLTISPIISTYQLIAN